MRSWQYPTTKFGLENILHLNFTTPLPKPKADQHLIQIITTALNPINYKPTKKIPGVTRFAIPKPATPSIYFVGTIVKPASGSSLKPGQLVFGVASNLPLAGDAFAGFCVLGSKSIVALSNDVEPFDIAIVGVAGLIACQSIASYLKIKKILDQ